MKRITFFSLFTFSFLLSCSNSPQNNNSSTVEEVESKEEIIELDSLNTELDKISKDLDEKGQALDSALDDLDID